MTSVRRRLSKPLATFLLCSVTVPLAVAVTVLATLLFVPLPAELPEPRASDGSQASNVYLLEANGSRRQIAVFREYEQNVPVDEPDVPTVLKDAVVSAEDQSFYRHGGIDLRGSLRALAADVWNQSVVQGGSTITQQYVRSAYVTRERTLARKVREAVLAKQLDRQLDKDEILFRYLSGVYLGEGAYGVGAASETYFRKPVSQLTLSEAALLAGLIPSPSRYEPRGNPAMAESKRRLVLTKMLEQGLIDRRQFDEALAQQVWLASQGPAPGPATVVYPPQEPVTELPYFVDYVRRYLLARYGPAKVFRGGLDITVTVDPVKQALAEATVAAQLKGTAPPLEMSMVSVEPATGYVKALVGGRDFAAAQVNLALGGCPSRPADPKIKVEVEADCWDGPSVDGGGTGRQPGSAFKPFVLSTALSEGVLPTKVYRAPPVLHIPGCRPGPGSAGRCTIGNAEGGGGGSASVRQATVASINTVYAQLVRDVGCKDTAETAKKLGVTAAWYSPQFHTCSGTYALGVIDVSPLDMASAFGVLGAGGRRVGPTPVLVATEPGPRGERRVLEDNTQPQPKQVVPEAVADTVTDILKGVITSGTATAADIGRPAAGKTGTGQNFTNAWFVGYTPALSTAVWMGYSDDQATPLTGIKGVSRVFGGTIPARTWHDFMAAALKDVPATDFSEPPPISSLARAFRPPGAGPGRGSVGVAPGSRRGLAGTGSGGPYEVAPPRLVVTARPPPTTPPPPTPVPTTATTTTTTVPRPAP